MNTHASQGKSQCIKKLLSIHRADSTGIYCRTTTQYFRFLSAAQMTGLAYAQKVATANASPMLQNVVSAINGGTPDMLQSNCVACCSTRMRPCT